MSADLHCHTIVSEGTMGIEDLMVLAKSNGVQTISITDHDCIASSVRGAAIARRSEGIDVVIGCEFSATDVRRRKNVSILCYMPESPERLEELCLSNTNIRITAGKIMARNVIKKFNVTARYIVSCANGSNYISKHHIMQALINCGFTTEHYGELYHSLFDRESPDYIGIEPRFPSCQEIIEKIHNAGGMAVLAHPAVNNNFELAEELSKSGLLDGIEVWSPRHSEEDVSRLIEIANRYGLYMTGGSDFNGAFNMEPVSVGACSPKQEALDLFLNFRSKRNRRRVQNG